MKTNKIVFKNTYTAYFQFYALALLSIVPFSFPYALGVKLDGIVVFFSIIACSIIFYYGLSNILKKSILVKGEKVIFSHGPFKYNLDVKKIALYYEKVSILGGRFKDYYGLVLYRDVDKILGMSFNNRFVLAYEMDEIKLEIYKEKFKDLLDIEIKVVKAL